MQLVLDGTPSEINELLNLLAVELDDEVTVPDLKTGYDMEQEDLSYLSSWSFYEDYKGFRVYKTRAGFGYTENTFHERLEHKTLDLCRAEINMIINKMNR